MIPRFRAWDDWRKRMSVVDRIYIDTKGVRLYDDFGEYWRNFRDAELMQSTGLCDKEGTEVFEGDILHHQIQKEYTFIVKYDKEKGCWYGDGLSRTYRIKITKDFLPYYKVIGNIYENKDLLEVENED